MMALSNHTTCFLGLCAGFLALAMVACESSPASRRSVQIPLPEPVPAPQVPVGATANRMTLLVSPSTEDSDGNGFPDIVHVTSSLFSHPHPTPMQAQGTFVFELHAIGQSQQMNGEPLAVWRRGPQQNAEVQTMALYGRCYPFSLSLEERRWYYSRRDSQCPLSLDHPPIRALALKFPPQIWKTHGKSPRTCDRRHRSHRCGGPDTGGDSGFPEDRPTCPTAAGLQSISRDNHRCR